MSTYSELQQRWILESKDTFEYFLWQRIAELERLLEGYRVNSMADSITIAKKDAAIAALREQLARMPVSTKAITAATDYLYNNSALKRESCEEIVCDVVRVLREHFGTATIDPPKQEPKG